MIKKVVASTAVAASVVGASAAAAPRALAVGDDGGTTSARGSGASQSFGDSATYGTLSPQTALIKGALHRPCLGLPAKANAGSLLGVAPSSVQETSLSSQNRQCVGTSTRARRDEAPSHILGDTPVLAGDGAAGNR
ncbi:rodlin [Streptomyces sp. NPDC005925]|uniref:rodlin n=1 Tax=Streptomyces sp. NPDC005925 TaxID=3157172 RepID=UPI0033DE44DA